MEPQFYNHPLVHLNIVFNGIQFTVAQIFKNPLKCNAQKLYGNTTGIQRNTNDWSNWGGKHVQVLTAPGLGYCYLQCGFIKYQIYLRSQVNEHNKSRFWTPLNLKFVKGSLLLLLTELLSEMVWPMKFKGSNLNINLGKGR